MGAAKWFSGRVLDAKEPRLTFRKVLINSLLPRPAGFQDWTLQQVLEATLGMCFVSHPMHLWC